MHDRQRTLPIGAFAQRDGLAQSNAVVDGVAGALAPAAHRHYRHTQRARVHAADDAGTIGVDRLAERRLWQISLVPFDKIGGAALRGDHTREYFGRPAVIQRLLQLAARLFFAGRQLAGHQHFAAQRQRHLQQARVTLRAGQEAYRFAHFQRIARAGGEHLVHIGEQRGGGAARTVGHADDRLRQVERRLEGRHKGAGADFDVHYQRVQPFGQLFRQNRGGDQRNRIHRSGDIARGVKALIRRRQRAGLADNRHADLFDNLAETIVVRENIEARDRFQLVQRAAGMAEAASGNHRHIAAAGGHHRSQHQRGDVADAAGGVLIDHRTVEVQRLPVQHGARIAHRHGERHALRQRHIVKKNGHRQRGDLTFGNAVIAHAVDEEANFLFAQPLAIALFTDNFLRQKHNRPHDQG